MARGKKDDTLEGRDKKDDSKDDKRTQRRKNKKSSKKKEKLNHRNEKTNDTQDEKEKKDETKEEKAKKTITQQDAEVSVTKGVRHEVKSSKAGEAKQSQQDDEISPKETKLLNAVEPAALKGAFPAAKSDANGSKATVSHRHQNEQNQKNNVGSTLKAKKRSDNKKKFSKNKIRQDNRPTQISKAKNRSSSN
uniref:Natural killer-tumor recognition protein n=1 Tax=Panagrolaimus sp. ES5 TaxID=591445 RepID=A0AC34GC27_9BILA